MLPWVAGLSDDDLKPALQIRFYPGCGQRAGRAHSLPSVRSHLSGSQGARHPIVGASTVLRCRWPQTPGQTCPRCQKTVSTRSNRMYHDHHHCSHRDISPSSPQQSPTAPAAPPESRPTQARLVPWTQGSASTAFFLPPVLLERCRSVPIVDTGISAALKDDF